MRIRRGWKWLGPTGRRASGSGPMWELVKQHLEWLRAHNYSLETVRSREAELSRFLTWCDDRSVSDPTEVTQPIIERYQRWLFYYRRASGKPLSFATQNRLMVAVKQFFRWTARQHLTLFNPAAEIELPRLPHRLPRNALTVVEVEAVMSQPDVTDSLGLRDRAMLETFYATGIRRSELANLDVYDLDTARGTVMVREGKWKKDRVVPIGERACAWINKYLVEVRPLFLVDPDEKALFLTIDGTRFVGRCGLGVLVKKYLRAADVTKAGCCHLFRHTAATLMLENGADVRFIQEMLGHASLETTQAYTHVTIAKLKQIYAATHPAARTGREPEKPRTLTADEERLLEDLAANAEKDDSDDEPDTRTHPAGEEGPDEAQDRDP